MRYVQTTRGLLLGPQRHVSHADLLYVSGLPKSDVLSAGFLAARYSPSEPWSTYGRSVGLDVAGDTQLRVPELLWAAKLEGTYPRIVFSDNPKLLKDLDVVPAEWGLSEEGFEGSVAVFSPLHPAMPLTADEIMRS